MKYIKTHNFITSAEKNTALQLCKTPCVCPIIAEEGNCPCDVFNALCKYNANQRRSIDGYTWAQISEISKMGAAFEDFNVGDTKTIELCTGEIVTAVILGFNHDKLSGEMGNAGITFGLLDCLDGEYEMNADDTNIGGWNESKMRNVYMKRLFSLLPTELQLNIKTVQKTTSIGDRSANINYSHDKLFLFSEVEVTGAADYSANGEGEQYEFYKNENNRIKHRNNSAVDWWLRSPYTSNAAYFRAFNASGSVGYNSASYTCGVSFGFCI